MEIEGLEAFLKEENARWARGVLESVGKQIELLEIAREASRSGPSTKWQLNLHLIREDPSPFLLPVNSKAIYPAKLLPGYFWKPPKWKGGAVTLCGERKRRMRYWRQTNIILELESSFAVRQRSCEDRRQTRVRPLFRRHVKLVLEYKPLFRQNTQVRNNVGEVHSYKFLFHAPFCRIHIYTKFTT